MSVISEMPQRMLNSAVAFFLAAARCRPPVPVTPTQWYATHAPPIVCYALSIELYLKLLILITTGRQAHGHDLADLYAELDHQTLCVTKLRGRPSERMESLVEGDLKLHGVSQGGHVFLVVGPAHELFVDRLARDLPALLTKS